MKAISLWQPWASLWLSDAKVHETRHWPTHYRGWLLVHAAKRAIDDFSDERLDEICDRMWGHSWGMVLPRGALIGAVELIDCRQMAQCEPAHNDDRECGDWQPARFAWKRGKFQKFDTPIGWRGTQGIFNVPDEILPKIAAGTRMAGAEIAKPSSAQGALF